MDETITFTVWFGYWYPTVNAVSKDIDHCTESHSHVPIASKPFPIPQ